MSLEKELCIEELIDLMKEPFTDYFLGEIEISTSEEAMKKGLIQNIKNFIEYDKADLEKCLDLLFPKKSKIIKCSSSNADEIKKFILFKLDKNNEISLLKLAKTYFTLYPTHGEVAGAIFGFLYKRKAKREIKELLKVIKKYNPELFWDT